MLRSVSNRAERACPKAWPPPSWRSAVDSNGPGTAPGRSAISSLDCVLGPRVRHRRRGPPDLVPWDPMTAAERIEQYPFVLRRHLGPGSLAGNESARDKDRLIVRAIPELLASAGLRIVPIHG